MKLCTLILMLFIFNVNVLATDDVYYSPYSEFSAWSNDYIEGDDTHIVEYERRYQWYKETNELGGYYIEGTNDSIYPLIDYNDFYSTPFSEWQETKPNNELNRIINSRYVYEYQDMKEVRYIHLNNLQGSYGSLRISEIEVYAGSNKIPYNFYCEGCNSNFTNYINNGTSIENMSYVNNGGYLRLDLNNYYPLDSITIKLYLFDVGTDTKRYSIKITRDCPFNSASYAEVTMLSFFTYSHLSEITPVIYNITKMNITNPEWDNKKRSLSPVGSTPTRKVTDIIEYQYQDFMYRYYDIKKEHAGVYSTEAIGSYNIIDNNQYEDYYRYQSRDKIVFKDNLVITNKDTKLEDFILDSTTDNINIESNIDINKNGTYQVKYILPFQTVIKEVTIDISDNIVNNLNIEIKKLTDVNNELTKQLLTKDDEINKYIKEKNDLINTINNNISYIEKESINTYKLTDKLEKMDKILRGYENRLQMSTDIINHQQSLIKILNSPAPKGDLNATLLKIGDQNIEDAGFEKIVKIIRDNPLIYCGAGTLLLIILLLWLVYKKRSN